MCLLSYQKIYLCTVFLILSYIDVSISSLPDGFSCVPEGPCTCVGPNDQKVDLSPLKSILPLVASTNKELFMYHPCEDAPLNAFRDNDCQKSFGVCHFVPNKTSDSPIKFADVISDVTVGNFTKLALNSEAVIQQIGMKVLQIVFKHTNNMSTFTTIIKLDCDEEVKDYKLTIEESQNLQYVLTLSTPHVCIHVPHHMSGGAVFFLILLSFLALYFIGGVLVLKFIRGAQGVEMIPNHEFWLKLPQLIKAGFMNLVNCSKSTPDSYEKI